MRFTIISIVILIMLANFAPSAQKSKNQTIEFEVKGVCNMCKKRIEDAAIHTRGVLNATWNKETQKITVVYNLKNTNVDAIHTNIAKAGHDTDKSKADAEIYAKLPGCCKYRNGVKVH